MRVVFLALAALCAPALDGSLYNTDIYAPPEPGAKPGTGRVVIYHQGVGEVAKGYFKRHAPGEVAEFHLFIPDGVKPGKRYPLLIVYHGGKDGGSGRGFAKSLGRVSTAQHPVFVLSPNMYTVDAYDEIVAEGTHPIDPARVVVMGFSSGGMGCGAAMRAHVADPATHPFACFVMMSTFGKPPTGYASRAPVIVVAGENETPEYAKHPALKQRRDACRRASLSLLGHVPEPRYIEMRSHGHTANKTEHRMLLRNLLRGIGAERFACEIRKPRDEVQPMLAAARAERWAAVRVELDRLESDSKLAHVSRATRSKLTRLFGKWSDRQVKTLRRLSAKSSHLAKTQALHTYDNLRSAAAAFDGHALGTKLAKSLKKLDGAKQLQREVDARERWNTIVKLGDHDKITAALQELRSEMADTEYGRNRTREVLLALGG